MLFDTTDHCQQSKTNWDTMPTMQQAQNATNFANFHARVNQPPAQQPRVPQFQKNETRSARRYSSGTPTNNGYGVPIPPTMTQSINGGAGRRVGSKGTYRSATFHQPNNNTFNNFRQQPQSNQQTQSGGQLRTSSSFHGCIQQNQPQQQQTPQQMPYNGRNSYTAPHQQQNQSKPSIYTVSGNFHPGMKDVPIWLKSLRLHKYTQMFQRLSYDEMMALDDQKLEQRQVTKGARKKILQSLDKLRDRSQLIRQLEKCIDEHGDVRCLIVELRAMMNTPIAAYKPIDEPKPSNYVIDAIGIPACEVSDENLPGHLSRLCLRLHEFLFRNGLPKIQELGIEDEYLLKLLQVYDKILNNEAFTYRQRYCIFECKRVISRYMHEQKILNNNQCLVPPYSQQTLPSSQPTLVSSPSSGYHTMSPPSSSTRRNSDTKESVEDLTATTTATSSDDDFHAHSAPSSPPAPFLNPYQYQQLNQMSLRHSPEQWSQQQQQSSTQQVQCPPGFEWLHSSTTPTGNNSTSQQPKSAANLLHFQPYVNDQFMNIGSIGQMQQRSNVWFNQPQETSQLNFSSSVQRQNQWDQRVIENEKSNLNSLFDSKPALCNYLASQLEQPQHQASIAKPPKATSPIGTKPTNYMQKNEANGALTICDKFKLLENDDDGPEILNLAFQFAMKVKSQKSRENVAQKPTVQQQILWQNVKEQPKQQTSLWSNVAPTKQAAKPNPTSLYSSLNDQRIHLPSDFVKKQEFYDPWSTSTSQQQDLSLSDQLTASTTSTAPSDSNLFGNVNSSKPHSNQTPLENNCLNRMLSENQICGGQSQQHQRIMRQYLPDESTQNENRLFSGITRSEDLRALLNDHASTETMFTAFQPLSYTSGAVH